MNRFIPYLDVDWDHIDQGLFSLLAILRPPSDFDDVVCVITIHYRSLAVCLALAIGNLDLRRIFKIKLTFTNYTIVLRYWLSIRFLRNGYIVLISFVLQLGRYGSSSSSKMKDFKTRYFYLYVTIGTNLLKLRAPCAHYCSVMVLIDGHLDCHLALKITDDFLIKWMEN